MNRIIVSRYLSEKSNIIIGKGSCSSERVPNLQALSRSFSETYHFSYSFFVFEIAASLRLLLPASSFKFVSNRP